VGVLLTLGVFAPNSLGFIGRFFSAFFFGLLGFGAFILPLAIIGIAVFALKRRGLRFPIGLSIALVWLILAMLHIVNSPDLSEMGAFTRFRYVYEYGGRFSGGLLGALVGELLIAVLGNVGSIVALAASILIISVLLTGRSFVYLVTQGANAVGSAATRAKDHYTRLPEDYDDDHYDDEYADEYDDYNDDRGQKNQNKDQNKDQNKNQDKNHNKNQNRNLDRNNIAKKTTHKRPPNVKEPELFSMADDGIAPADHLPQVRLFHEELDLKPNVTAPRKVKKITNEEDTNEIPEGTGPLFARRTADGRQEVILFPEHDAEHEGQGYDGHGSEVSGPSEASDEFYQSGSPVVKGLVEDIPREEEHIEAVYDDSYIQVTQNELPKVVSFPAKPQVPAKPPTAPQDISQNTSHEIHSEATHEAFNEAINEATNETTHKSAHKTSHEPTPETAKDTASTQDLVIRSRQPSQPVIATDAIPSYEDFVLPPINLLNEPPAAKSMAESRTQILENSRILEETLRSFRIEAKVVEVSVGPTVTRYDLAPGPGVKVSSIANLSNDLALSLAAQGIRIEAPIPGKSAVGIEIPNKEPQPVYLREIIQEERFNKFPSKLAFAVGKDIAGEPVVTDIARMPHLLIAGATGSGKSVCINTLIASLLYKARPDQVKLLMIDPKVVELSVYNGIPHLLIPVVTDPKKASGALSWAVSEMESRYIMFAETGCRDLKGFNIIRTKALEPELPQIVIIIDELADLMMACKGEVEESICRLAQKARAAGIHLIVATQRPSVDVITGLIKANIPSRLAFAVSSGTDSRTVLDMYGAEKLLGKGDMLFLPMGMSKPVRIQGGFISDNEVENLVSFLKAQAPVVHSTEMIQQVTMPGKANVEGEVDEFFHDAVDFLLVKGKASTSMLQRQFRIGYNRASRLMDELETRGIVGPEDGVKPRKVTITRDEYFEIYGRS